jgi:hypothetical protein
VRASDDVIAFEGRNFEVTDCDLYSSWGVITTDGVGTTPAAQAQSGYGYVARNKLWNGHGPTFDLDGSKQWIFEANQIVGTSVMAGGHGARFETEVYTRGCH